MLRQAQELAEALTRCEVKGVYVDDCEHSGAYVVVPLRKGHALVSFGLTDAGSLELGIYQGRYEDAEGEQPLFFSSFPELPYGHATVIALLEGAE